MPWTPADNLKSNTVLLIFISLQYYGFRNYSIKHFATWLSLDLIKNLLVTINNAKISWSGSYTDQCRRLKPTVNVSHRGPRNHGVTIEFSLNVFTEFTELSDKILVKGLELATLLPLVMMLPQHQQDTYERQDL